MANEVPGDQTRPEAAGDAASQPDAVPQDEATGHDGATREGGAAGRDGIAGHGHAPRDGWATGVGAGIGALSLVGGVTWTLLNVHSPQPIVDMGVGVVLALGGLVLLMPHRIPLPPLVTTAAAAGTAVVGTAAGLLAGTAQGCCMYAYVAERGFPMRWVGRGAIADDPQTAQRLAETAPWQVDLTALVANVLIWGYAGMLVVALAVMVRRAR